MRALQCSAPVALEAEALFDLGPQVRQERVQTYTVGIVGAERAPSLKKALSDARSLRIETVTPAEAQQRVKDRRLRAAMVAS